jgi:hypothetical protein
MMGRELRKHEGMKDALTILIGKLEGNGPLERYLSGAIGKGILKEFRVRMATGFTWLQTGSNVWLL